MKVYKPFFLLVFMLFTKLVYSQTNTFNLGFEGGSGLVNLRGNETYNNERDPAIGNSLGFTFQYDFKRIISFRTGIMGETKGCITTVALTDQSSSPFNSYELKTNLYYISLPVMLRASFGKKIQYFINAGGFVGYLVKQINSEVLQLNQASRVPFQQVDYGVSAGLGLLFPINTKSAITFEIRNNLGLCNLSSGLSIIHESIKTNAALFLISYSHKIGLRKE